MDETTTNELPPLPDPPPTPEIDPLPFQRPADYYSSPDATLRPIFPKWVPVGCGWSALVFVILLFAGGALAPSSGLILDWLFGKIESDLVQHFAKDVTAAQKASFASEMRTMRSAAEHGKLKLDKTQSFLRLATDVDGDEKVDAAEADKLIAAVRGVNQSLK